LRKAWKAEGEERPMTTGERSGVGGSAGGAGGGAGARGVTGGAGAATGSNLPPITEERRVTDLETLRILTDPLRLAILGAFAPPDAPPMSVKEIAEELDEGQTKLYRHVKQLEESGLIHVAETRVVSGIIEKRYRPSQRRLYLESDLLRLSATDEYYDTLVAVLEATRTGLSTDLRTGRVVLDKPEHGTDLSIKLSVGKGAMTPERYAEIRDVLGRLIDEMDADLEAPDAIPVVLQVLLYTTVEPSARNTGSQNTASESTEPQETENPPSTKSS
jgi:DNA-binding transcriptional ArsR family regulator